MLDGAFDWGVVADESAGSESANRVPAPNQGAALRRSPNPSVAAEAPGGPAQTAAGPRVREGRRRWSSQPKMLCTTLASSPDASSNLPRLYAGQGRPHRAASRVFEAAGDETALVRARALAGADAHIEIWELSRRVYLTPRGKASA